LTINYITVLNVQLQIPYGTLHDILKSSKNRFKPSKISMELSETYVLSYYDIF